MFRRSFGRQLIAAALCTAGLLSSRAGPAKPRTVREPNQSDTPAAKYARLSKESCVAALRKRKISFESVESAAGVLAPVRLPQPVGGVRFRSELAPPQRRTSPHDVFDCRLVLALSDWATTLGQQHVVEVVIFSAWRPPVADTVPKGESATRHPGGLAVDVRALVVKEPGHPERRVEVASSWTPALKRAPCGPKASPVLPKGPDAKLLRDVTCDAVDERLFTVVLTPNYNHAHHNHLHLEITPDVDWFLVR